MRELKSVIVVPTRILDKYWTLKENDKFLVIDFTRSEACFFDHEPLEKEIAKKKTWFPLVLSKEDKKAIYEYIRQNKHRFSKAKDNT